MAERGPFFVYILHRSDGSLYVGHSANVSGRVRDHNAGLGAAWTAWRTPVVLVDAEAVAKEEDAVRRERQIKRWPHAKKQALVDADLARLKELSKSR